MNTVIYMTTLLLKTVQKSRKNRRNAQSGKSGALIEAGMRLLAQKDYDSISMAQIAREAGCSIGAVYSRYTDKEEYLYRLTALGLRNMESRANLALAKAGWARTRRRQSCNKLYLMLIKK